MLNKGIPTQVWKHPNAQNHNSYESQHGSVIWEFGVKFENGQTGVFGGQDAEYPKFKVGELAHYEFTESKKPGTWPDKLKFVSEQDAGTGFGPPPEETAQDQGFGPPEDPEAKQAFESHQKGLDQATTVGPVNQAPAPKPATPFENPLKTWNINRQAAVRSAAIFCQNRTETGGAKGWQEIAEEMFAWTMIEENQLPF